ncbi:hypothetical protein RJ640_000369 [Escallonia rubra]|uniref:Methyltransferase PMT26 n=1 Tax=Escallonia rubra TaxID=112253 RepID=A0AA88USM1_9ASTE|nr:hypothetical protein RJ640_000369 [Escallonia rubra]
MAMGKYSRVDGRKSSKWCSTVTIVVFVGFCLVGVWMLMSSSSGVAAPNSDVSAQEPKEVKQKVVEKFSKPYEDISGDLPEDTGKEEHPESSQDGSTSNVEDSQNLLENVEGKNESEEDSKREAETDEDAKSEDNKSNSGDRESNSEGGESNSGDGDSNSSGEDKRMSETETSTNEQQESEDSPSESTSNPDGGESKTDVDSSVEEDQSKDQASNEGFPAGAQSEILKETTADSGAWSTQAAESQSEKESQKSPLSKDQNGYKWKLCNVTAGPDYIPCLDNVQVIKKLPSTNHYEHRERHCPDEAPTCLVPLPEGYKQPVRWPRSREQIWYSNVPHTKLADVKGHQNWVKVSGDHLTFPGGGTQFKHGALHYIDFIQKSLSKIAWGNRTRVILDVGCGVASFGGYLFDRDVLAMSLAPKDEHEAQVQFALERGIPAISAVMGTKRLPFPSKVFDVVHCARCRVPWHIEGGKLLLELNRVLRPGGYFVWSATPVYQKLPEDVGIWKAMSELTKSMCWELLVVNNDKLNQVGVAIYRKPMSNQCYEKREQNEPPLCKEDDDPDAVWNVQLQACMHKVPVGASDRGKQLPKPWPLRLGKPPYWLTSSQVGVYGKAAPEDFTADYEHWQRVVSTSYLNGLGIDWSSVRNVMDMRAVYGGFAAALRDLKVWVMNVVTIDSPDTLPLIYERGLFGIYHDWCESFSTYPRSYDLVHADHVFSNLKKRCKLEAVIAEVDRILRPEGKLIVQDSVETIAEVEKMAKSLQWKIRLTYSNDSEGLLCVQKTLWRPTEAEAIFSAIA